mmetsp:Transcript_22560/g.19551  ORF Transcript_22560/g.19551 Transcript_22560/m.19551 type:complete len:120 (+) Transcript_22560:1769-2128(+)
MEFEWTNSISGLNTFIYANRLKITKGTYDLSGFTEIKFTSSAENSTNHAYAEKVLAINTPPLGGTLTISPESGESLSTNFTIKASGWTDVDKPILYQFVFALDDGNEETIPNEFSLSDF